MPAISSAFVCGEKAPLTRMLETGFRAPATSSVGRLFDGVASLLGLHQKVAFEGQAAMALEYVAEAGLDDAYPLPLVAEGGGLLLDWEPLVDAALDDVKRGGEVSVAAARFHGALVEAIVAVAERIGEPRVALTGGCFQNRLLTERAAGRLEGAGFDVLVHRRVPANDGGISLGQVAVAAARLETRR